MREIKGFYKVIQFQEFEAPRRIQTIFAEVNTADQVAQLDAFLSAIKCDGWGIIASEVLHTDPANLSAKALGAMTSEKKASASRENGKKGGRPRKVAE